MRVILALILFGLMGSLATTFGVVMRVILAFVLFGLLAGCMADRPYRDDMSWRVLRDYSHHGHEHWRR